MDIDEFIRKRTAQLVMEREKDRLSRTKTPALQGGGHLMDTANMYGQIAKFLGRRGVHLLTDPFKSKARLKRRDEREIAWAKKQLFGRGVQKPKRKMSAKMKRRCELVKKVMKQTGMTLPQASSYVKQHNLPF